MQIPSKRQLEEFMDRFININVDVFNRFSLTYTDWEVFVIK